MSAKTIPSELVGALMTSAMELGAVKLAVLGGMAKQAEVDEKSKAVLERATMITMMLDIGLAVVLEIGTSFAEEPLNDFAREIANVCAGEDPAPGLDEKNAQLSHAYRMKVRALRTIRDAIDEHEEDTTPTLNRLSDLLTRTANALKGEPPELVMHDWSDLPKVAAESRASTDRLVDHIARESHAVGISDTATPEQRVSWMRAVIESLRNERGDTLDRAADEANTVCGDGRCVRAIRALKGA